MRKLLATAVLAALSFNAYAIPVEWTLTDVTMRYGGTLTGGFTYDNDTNVYSDIAITYSNPTSSGLQTNLGGTATSFAFANAFYLDANLYAGPNANVGIDIFYQDELTNAGGVVELFAGSFSVASSPNFGSDDIVSGSLTGTVVPIPAAVWLFGSALAGLGWMRRKQTA